MESYSQMKDRHQQEVNDFPFGFAFTNESFDRMMKSWHLNPNKKKDLRKIYSVGVGGYVRKKDSGAMKAMFARHREERNAAIANDFTGEGFIYQMFLYELKNHEYGYTGDPDDAIAALELTHEKIEADYRLSHGFEKAKNKIWGEC